AIRLWTGDKAVEFALLAGHAAIDGEDLAGDVAGGGAGEEEDAGGDVFGQAEPLGGDALLGFFDDHLAGGFGHFAFDKARADGVDGELAAGELAAEATRESNQAGFAGRIVGLSGIADEAADAGDVDDASVAGPHHVTRAGAGEEERAAEVGVDDV